MSIVRIVINSLSIVVLKVVVMVEVRVEKFLFFIVEILGFKGMSVFINFSIGFMCVIIFMWVMCFFVS